MDIGYDANADLFMKNARVKRAEFFFSDGTSFEYTFPDQRGLQTIFLDQEIVTDSVQVIIRDVYQGSKYNDTAISEMEFWGMEQ